MSQLEELKGIKEKLDNGTCTISDLKNIYEFVNTKSEVIVAKNVIPNTFIIVIIKMEL